MNVSGIIRAIDTQTKNKMFASGIVASLLAVSLVVTLGFYGGIFDPTTPISHANDPIFTINNTVANDFADFVPYDESFTPNASVYTISSDLSNIVNIGAYGTLSISDKDMIVQNGFTVRPQSTFKQIHEILEDNEDSNYPSFVSSDAVLHAFHIVYDLALRDAEVYSFWDLLGNMTISLAEDSYDQYQNAPEGRWDDAALKNTAYFYVAAYLLDNSTTVPSAVLSDVNEVLALIVAHDGFSDQWFMGYDDDFSQYVPRGHYTRSETLEKYFMAMMWYGRIGFHLQPETPPLPNDRGMDETAQAILISLALDNNIDSLGTGVSGYDVWDAIYHPTVFFVGAADDLLPNEYRELIEDIYGANVTLESLDNDALLKDFIDSALMFREPLILSSRLPDTGTMNMTKGMRFMGQRFIPDSYILGQLVYSNVGTPGLPRLMPMGLDVMAALGSDRAWDLLEDEKVYENYESQMQLMWDMIADMSDTEWTKNLYYLWLYSLLPLLTDPGEGYPLFMQSEAWVDKQLNTALGSWAELRHDTILYAKQSYTWELTAAPEVKHGYVEPLPRLYARLASLCKMMITGLEQRDLMSDWIDSKLDMLHSFLLSLKEISLKELSGEPLNQTEIYIIEGAGSTLSSIVMMPTDDEITSDADEFMAVIADVHTDINTLSVLEEAVGNPMIIYVAVLIDGQVVLTRGGSFSYYEFTQPMNDRLTDEAWQAMLEAGAEPPLPDWTSSFVAAEGGETLVYLATSVSTRDE
ncbi:MAG: DUF3160 domain-containing protein [Candidatus Thorarchaeota archaeon]